MIKISWTDKAGERNYYWYKEHGICTKCGRSHVELEKSKCSECLEKEAEHKRQWQSTLTREQLDRINEKRNLRKQRLREEGCCPACGKKIKDTRYKMCLDCRLYFRKWKKEHIERKRWKECGLCWHCGSKDVVEGKTLCPKCLEKMREVAMKNLSLAKPNNSYFKALNNLTWNEICQKKN